MSPLLHDSSPLLRELIEALVEHVGLDQLGHAKLARLASASEAGLGFVGDFSAECRHAWELTRPPTDDDLIELEQLSPNIDWTDNTDLEHGANLDLGTTATTPSTRHPVDLFDWYDDEDPIAAQVDVADIVDALAEEHADLLDEIRLIALKRKAAA